MTKLQLPQTTLIVFLIFIFATSINAEVPKIINYQGRLTNTDGTPADDDNYQMKFVIYGSESGSDSLWSSGFNDVSVTNGLFTYFLGSITTLPDSIFNSPDLYLGISVGSDEEISGRTKFTSSAFTFKALKSDTTDYAKTIADLSVTQNKIADNAINTYHIQDGSIDLVDLGSGGAANGETIIWNNSAMEWEPGAVGTGDVTSVTAGSGLSGGGTSGDIALSVGTGAITATHMAVNSIQSDAIAPNAVGASEIGDNAVGASELANGVVYETHIADNAVTQSKIAQNAVTSYELADDAVGFREITTGAVRSSEIYDGTIQQADLSFTAVDESSTQTITGTKTFNDLNINTSTRRLSLSQAAFVPAREYNKYTRQLGAGNYLANAFASDIEHEYHCNVSLPDGAVITQFEVYYYDNEAIYDGVAALVRVNTNDGYYYNIAGGSTSGTPGNISIVDNSINDATVDNENNVYMIRITITYSSAYYDMRLYGAKIEYTITKPLP